MNAKDYNKADPVGFGHAIGDLIDAVRGDGVDVGDFQHLIGIVTKAGASVNEAKAVPEAAAEHVVSGITERLGDKAVARAIAAEDGPILPPDPE